MNEINCTLTPAVSPLTSTPMRFAMQIPGQKSPTPTATAIRAPRKCTETMLLSPICQWPNGLPPDRRQSREALEYGSDSDVTAFRKSFNLRNKTANV